MLIVELVDSLQIGGTERMVVNLSLGLAARRHRVVVVCLRGSGPLEKPLQAAGIEVVALHKPEGVDFSTARRLTRLVKDRGVDVVHTHNPLVHHYGVIAARLASIPVVSTVHGLNNLEKLGKSSLVYLATSPFTQRIVVVCGMAREFFLDRLPLPRKKFSVVYNGIPVEPFLQLPRKAPSGEFVFGTIGRLVPIKDHESLLNAFLRLSGKHPRCRLEILGDGPLRAELERRSETLGLSGRVFFRGANSDVRDFLTSLDAFVLSSKSEGLPMTILEAMAGGLPIVATAVGGIPEVVDGVGCGWTAPPCNPAALADAMELALLAPDLREKGQRGRAAAAAGFSLEKMSADYELLFQKCLEEQGRSPKESRIVQI
jgi:glycosyltransferase involved in cell wall biosynthesis